MSIASASRCSRISRPSRWLAAGRRVRRPERGRRRPDIAASEGMLPSEGRRRKRPGSHIMRVPSGVGKNRAIDARQTCVPRPRSQEPSPGSPPHARNLVRSTSCAGSPSLGPSNGALQVFGASAFVKTRQFTAGHGGDSKIRLRRPPPYGFSVRRVKRLSGGWAASEMPTAPQPLPGKACGWGGLRGR